MFSSNVTRQEKIDGLRAMLDFFEANPEFPMPFDFEYPQYHQWRCKVDTKEELLQMRQLLGSVEKADGGDELNLIRRFGPHRLALAIEKSKTCKQVQVGTKVIPAMPERLVPATEEREVPIYAWECESVLDNSESESHAAL